MIVQKRGKPARKLVKEIVFKTDKAGYPWQISFRINTRQLFVNIDRLGEWQLWLILQMMREDDVTFFFTMSAFSLPLLLLCRGILTLVLRFA